MVSIELMAVVWCLFVVEELIRHLKSYELNLPNHYANLEGKSLHWLKQTLIFTAIIWFFWAFSFVLIQYYPALSYLSYFNWISLALVIYWLAISIIIRRKVFESPAYGLGSTPASAKALPLKSEVGKDLSHATLYSTHEPCVMCAYSIRFHGISKVVFQNRVEKLGSYTSKFVLLKSIEIPQSWGPKPEVIHLP